MFAEKFDATLVIANDYESNKKAPQPANFGECNFVMFLLERARGPTNRCGREVT